MRTIPFETYKKTLADNILQSADYDALEERIMEAQWEMTDDSNYDKGDKAMIATIKQAIYKKLGTEVADENLNYLKSRVAEFSNLSEGWDGEGAQPLLPEATENVKRLLSACKPHDIIDWALFPNVNGTYLLQKQHALISIGDKLFTYWAEADGKDIGEEYVPFSVNSILDAIRCINAYA